MALNKVRIENVSSPVDVKITKPDASTVNIAQGNGVDLTLTIGSSDQLTIEQDPHGATQSTVRVINTIQKGSSPGEIYASLNGGTAQTLVSNQQEDFVIEDSDTLVVTTQ